MIFVRHDGLAWRFSMPPVGTGNTADAPGRSRLVVYEDGRALGPAHCSVDEIRVLGGGRFTHAAVDGGPDVVVFSTTDGSNPNANGRSYEFSVDGVAPRTAVFATNPVHPYLVDLRATAEGREFFAEFQSRNQSPLRNFAQDDLTLNFYAIQSAGSGSYWGALKRLGHPALEIGYDPREMKANLDDVTRSSIRPKLACVHNFVPIHGHLPHSRYCTILRDPVRRLVSHYSWWAMHGLITMPLHEWIGTLVEQGFFRNSYMIWFGNLALDYREALRLVTCPIREWPRTGDDRLFELSMQQAEKLFAFIGITEHFDESLMVNALLMGSPYVPMWSLLCQSTVAKAEQVEQPVIDIIREFCRPDIAFYDYWKNRFFEQYGAAIDFARKHLPSLKIES